MAKSEKVKFREGKKMRIGLPQWGDWREGDLVWLDDNTIRIELYTFDIREDSCISGELLKDDDDNSYSSSFQAFCIANLMVQIEGWEERNKLPDKQLDNSLSDQANVAVDLAKAISGLQKIGVVKIDFEDGTQIIFKKDEDERESTENS